MSTTQNAFAAAHGYQVPPWASFLVQRLSMKFSTDRAAARRECDVHLRSIDEWKRLSAAWVLVEMCIRDPIGSATLLGTLLKHQTFTEVPRHEIDRFNAVFCPLVDDLFHNQDEAVRSAAHEGACDRAAYLYHSRLQAT